MFEPGERSGAAAAGNEAAGWKSHVLLAACKQGQTADDGAFTPALLSLLEKESLDQLTYRDIIMNLPDLPSPK